MLDIRLFSTLIPLTKSAPHPLFLHLPAGWGQWETGSEYHLPPESLPSAGQPCPTQHRCPSLLPPQQHWCRMGELLLCAVSMIGLETPQPNSTLLSLPHNPRVLFLHVFIYLLLSFAWQRLKFRVMVPAKPSVCSTGQVCIHLSPWVAVMGLSISFLCPTSKTFPWPG